VVSALVVLGGCSTTTVVSRRAEARLPVMGSGAPAAAVFSDPRRPEYRIAGVETSRLDAGLGQVAGPQLASDQWPEPAQPSPRHARRIQFNNRPDTFLYFDRADPHHRDWGHAGHGGGGHWGGRGHGVSDWERRWW
jgi:hypothetical protein